MKPVKQIQHVDYPLVGCDFSVLNSDEVEFQSNLQVSLVYLFNST